MSDAGAASPGRPVRPAPAMDRDSRPWWDAMAAHRLLLQRCSGCHAYRWPARTMCGRCGSFVWTWGEASGRGTLVSWIVNHHRFSADIASPYTVATVRLAEQDDLLLPGGFDPSGGEPEVGLPVTVGFLDARGPDGEEFTLLQWRVATG